MPEDFNVPVLAFAAALPSPLAADRFVGKETAFVEVASRFGGVGGAFEEVVSVVFGKDLVGAVTLSVFGKGFVAVPCFGWETSLISCVLSPDG